MLQDDSVPLFAEDNEEEETPQEETGESTEPVTAYKNFEDANPIMTQRFGADPWVLPDGDTVYVYMTVDEPEVKADGSTETNTYANIRNLNVLSSKDLVNWTDHGCVYVAGVHGASSWSHNSWAPAAAVKEINGKKQYFLYYADGASGIGVLTGDSPVGPFHDPIGKPLITRDTPGCEDVVWLFEPAVLVDDDGTGYLYFGGGIPEGKQENPGTGRVVKLGADMVSVDGKAAVLDVPYLFEDSGINKIGDTYCYSYCSNWDVTEEATKKYGVKSAEIVYMTSKNPMGPFTLQSSILMTPGEYFGCYGNNHHCIFPFRDQWYIAYHTEPLGNDMKIANGYRCTFIDAITVHPEGSMDMGQRKFGIPTGHDVRSATSS